MSQVLGRPAAQGSGSARDCRSQFNDGGQVSARLLIACHSVAHGMQSGVIGVMDREDMYKAKRKGSS